MSSKLTPFDNRLFGDATIATIATTSVTHALLGGSWLVGIAFGLLYTVPALITVAILAALIATPPTYARATLVWALFAGIGGELLRGMIGLDLASTITGAVFLVGTTRSILVLRRAPALPAANGPTAALASAAASPAGSTAGPSPVPEDLSPEIDALVRAADRDFRHLCDALSDPALARAAGVDAAGMRAAGEELLRDVLRRAPLVDRVRRIAAERPDDADSRRAGDDALAGLRRQADALRAATAAALQIAAAERVDGSLLREHADNLHLLREARDEADAPVSPRPPHGG